MSRNRGSVVPFPGPRTFIDNLRLTRTLLVDPIPTLDTCAERYGPTFALRVGPVRLVVVGDPADLSQVFAQPSTSYRWGHWANVLGFIVGPTSMIVSDGEVHQRRRAVVQPAFARRTLDGWIPMILEETDRAIDRRLHPGLAEGRAVDIYPVGKDLVLAITVRAFFGNGLEHRTGEIGAIFDELQAYLELPGAKQIPHRLPFTQRARARAARHAFDAIVDDEIVRRRTTQPLPTADQPHDLLDVFLADGADCSPEEIHDQVNTLIGAGYNTTAATLAWTVQRALSSPGVWARLRVEASRAPMAGADLVAGAPEVLRALPFAGAVVREALRLHPAGAVSPRQAVTEIRVGDHVIPRSAMILWSPYLAGRNGGAWDDPLTFCPDRHLDPTPEAAARMDQAWLPFGKGPRRCIGFALAQMELTLILARLAQRLDLELDRPEVPAPYGMVVNRPQGGVPVRGAAAPG